MSARNVDLPHPIAASIEMMWGPLRGSTCSPCVGVGGGPTRRAEDGTALDEDMVDGPVVDEDMEGGPAAPPSAEVVDEDMDGDTRIVQLPDFFTTKTLYRCRYRPRADLLVLLPQHCSC